MVRVRRAWRKGVREEPALYVLDFDTGSNLGDVGRARRVPFDLVLCNHLLNDLEDPTQAIREFARILSAEGRIVIMMLRPCFYNKHAQRNQPGNNLVTSTYFKARSVTQNFEVDGLRSPSPNTAWLRPLEFYTKALQESGFAITSLSEPHPSEQQLQDDEWWGTSFTRLLFMLITAQRWPQ